ncbi:restriction endonuclease subunit S [Sorangium sp. So ce1151]|uniref:restriction endonuclease subunit S n=1 Tax=Sorangium sp. So ce1151 TaxID=3133332 RepID=UPI003F616E47
MSIWRDIRVSDLGRVVTGKTPPSSMPEHFGTGYPFITPSDIQDGQRAVEPERSISDLGKERQASLLLPPLTICVVCIGATIGKICMTNHPSFTNQQINSVIVDTSQHDPYFVYYLLSTLRSDLRAHAGGAATPIINKSTFSNVRLRVPEKHAQQCIGSILSAYDDLIENNTKRIKILEEITRSLYREWFVHFRFPGYEKMKLVGSPLGAIPHEWRVVPLTEVLDIRYGKTLPKTEMQCMGPYPVYGAGGVIGRYSDANIVGATTLITSRGAGSGTVWRARESGFVTNNSFIVRPIDMAVFDNAAAIQLLLEHANISAVVGGAAQPQLTLDGLSAVLTAVPPRQLCLKFDALAGPSAGMADALHRVNDGLRATRDLLLPRLLSGEIDVSRLEAPGA